MTLLTKITRYVSGTTGDTRVMLFGYDFRNRKISTTDATGRYFLDTWDNLSRFVQSQGYSAATSGTLFAQKQTKYDDRSRTYQTLTYAVNVSTGVVGNALVGSNWYDPSGNLLQSIGEGAGTVFTKSVFNGVNWPLSTYRGYCPGGTSYTQATTVANDIIVEQADNTFDEAGNQIASAMSQRLNDAPTSGSGSTGALSYGTSPKARVSYMATWFDGIDRAIANANYGAIASFTRPTTPPASSATILVTQSVYNDAGEAYQAIDPMGNITQTAFDDAGRKTQVTEAYGTLLPRITQFLYTLDNLISQMIAKNATTGDQVTTWDYGTTLASSGVARNDLLASVAYPDSSGPTDVVAYAYNRLAEQRTIQDQRGTIRSLYRDLLGRLTNDCVTTVGSNTDATVLQIARAYEIRGMLSTITSRDSAAQGAGTVLNQVQFTFNDFAQLTKDQQEHTGAVTSGTPSVQYGYDAGGSSSNEIRFNALTYPTGRVVSYNYATGMDATLNRVASISDSSGTLASYLYLGAGTVIRITYPQPGIWLDLWGGTSGTFAGIDRFGRVIDQRWQNHIATTPVDIDRCKYGYDLNSNRLWKNNVVGTAAVPAGLDEFYAYDPLNRLTDMQRGVLNSTQSGITGIPSVEQDWTLDPTGNWQNFTTKASGATTLNQSRSASTVNEITNISTSTGPTWVTPAYDAAGNTIRMPQPANPAAGFNALYDAWNRMKKIFTGGGSSSSSTSSSGSGGSGGGTSVPIAVYDYDGRNFRVVKETFVGGVLDEIRDVYFTAGWQDIEERVGGVPQYQFVWGIRYVDELICRADSYATELYATQDANFNLTSISLTSGGVVERYLYDPYGNRTIMNAAWATIGSSAYAWVFAHQGLMIDTESQLTDNRGRVVDTSLGRFQQRDRFRYVDSASLVEYCGSNPVGNIDPLGAWHKVRELRGGWHWAPDPGDFASGLNAAQQTRGSCPNRKCACNVRIFADDAFGLHLFSHIAIEIDVPVSDGVCQTHTIELLDVTGPRKGLPAINGNPITAYSGSQQNAMGTGPAEGIGLVYTGSGASSTNAGSAEFSILQFGGALSAAWGIYDQLGRFKGDALNGSPVSAPAGITDQCAWAQSLLTAAKRIARASAFRHAGYNALNRNSNTFAAEVLNSSGTAQITYPSVLYGALGWGADTWPQD